MNKYRIYGRYIEHGHIDVYANSEEDAYEKIENLNENKWIIDECGYWETGQCEEVE